MIKVENLTKNYGSTVAVKDVSFSVEKGSILGFLGSNGAGKTTTMRILSGYIPATSGKAIIAGFEVHENPMAVREKIGYLPENPPLYDDMTVKEYLSFVSKIKNIPRCDRTEKVKKALKSCQLEDRADSIIRKLSKGYRQRVGIAQAIVHEPPVIILDEPTVGLDPRQIIEVRNLIKSLAGESTIILSTHILPEVNMICDTVAIINRGEIVSTGKPENLLQEKEKFDYQLDVSGDMEIIREKLTQISGLTNLNITPHERKKERYLLDITLEGSEDRGKDIASAIIHQGGELYEMRKNRASLEEVFLQLTTSVN